MALSLICACGARFDVEDTHAGQEVSCPECQQSLKAPALRQPTLRTDDPALLSTVLAITGAFTVVGTIAAVVFGVIGLLRINRHRDCFAGTGFALFGIIAGTLFTTLTVLALSSDNVFSIGATIRRNQLADRVDTSGELIHENAQAGYRITRPSRDWGVSTFTKLDEPAVTALHGEKGANDDLLLVHMRRVLYADVHFERNRLVRDISILQDQLLSELVPANPNPMGLDRPFKGRRPPVEEGEEKNPSGITKVVPAPNGRKLSVGEGMEAIEREVILHFGRQQWKMLHRVYLTNDGRLYVVRGYCPVRHFAGNEAEMRKLMDSFTIPDGK